MESRSSNNEFRLAAHASLAAPEGPVVLVILDGVGIGPHDDFDAVAQARTPVLDELRARALRTELRAHGVAVGLPSDADMGNSEVGHNALGAGRVFDQGAKLVEKAIKKGTIWEGVWRRLIDGLLERDGALHLIGLLSDGNVHSHERQLWALIRRADEEGIRRVFVHPLLDGRDVAEASALIYLERLEQLLTSIDAKQDRNYRIASGGGRMVTTMDRYEADWAVVERGYNAHVHGQARVFSSARAAVETYREEEPGLIDQYLPPFVVGDEEGVPLGPIRDGDGVVFFNFRGDRALEISRAFEEGDTFTAFDRGRKPEVYFAGMMLYDGDLGIPRNYLVAPPSIDRTMGECLARNALMQFACAETQKFGHVTYFWNGNRSGVFDPRYEEYLEIPSDRVPFDQRPWMKSAETADALLEALRSRRFRFLRVNFAAGDMVGHTGKLEAAILAVQAVDLCLGRVVPEIERQRGVLVVTADHGNSDDMVERDKGGVPKHGPDGRPRPRTSHTLNPVEFLLVDASGRDLGLRADLDHPGLSNVAATVLELLGFEPPAFYDPSLLERCR